MRSLTVSVLFIVATVANGFFVPKTGKNLFPGKYAVVRQKAIFEIFQNILQDNAYEEHYNVGQNYSLEDNIDSYTKPSVVQNFLLLRRNGLLSKGEIFNIMNEKHLKEAISLFYVFYYAKDWDTVYNTLAWARNHVNGGVWIYAFSVALVHRKDLRGAELPPLFEVYPFHFINSDVIQKAYRYKMEGVTEDTVIPANYSGWYIRTSEEQKLSYFTEDVGLNLFFYYFNLDYPFWMDGEEFALNKDRRGELYLFTLRQLLARYQLERLSNNLGDTPELTADYRSSTPFYSSLRHHNGLDFPVRPTGYSRKHQPKAQIQISKAQDYERRLRDTIDFGSVFAPGGSMLDLRQPGAVNVLGNLIQGNPDSYNAQYYKNFINVIKSLLGNSFDTVDDNQYPSALDYFHTQLRDPATYQIFKKIGKYHKQLNSHLRPYSLDDIGFPGVKISSVEVDDLTTYFDKYEFDITNALYLSKEELTDKYGFRYKVSQQRLNHKPFGYKLKVVSNKTTDAVVRVFLGPKRDQYGDEVDIEKNRENFFQIDVIPHKLKTGINIITRKSSDYTTVVADSMSHWVLYNETRAAVKDKFTWNFDNAEAHCGLPERLLLPKGDEAGLEYQFFFVVSPYYAPAVPQFEGFDEIYSCGVGSGARYVDDLPLGFPFDRKIDHSVFPSSNMVFHDVLIRHKVNA